MYPGVFAISAIFPFVKARPQFQPDSMSFLQTRTIRAQNNVVHRDTTLVPDPIVGEAKTAAFEMWGAKFPGCAARYSSQTRLPDSLLSIDVY